MSLPEAQEFVEPGRTTSMGIKQRWDFKTVLMGKRLKFLGITTRTEHTISNGAFSKLKVRLCATMVNHWQQEVDLQTNARDLFAQVLKSAESCLMAAIAAQHGAKMQMRDTTQAFLYCDIDEDLYVLPPD